MTIRVGRWDCTHCGHKGVLGPEIKCTNCGAARPKNVRFYLPSDAEIVQDADELRRARSGANWKCSFCQSDNEAGRATCIGCGNSRSASEKRLRERDYTLADTPQTSEQARALAQKDKEQAEAERRARAQGEAQPQSSPSQLASWTQKLRESSPNKKRLLLAAIPLTLFLILLSLFFIRFETIVQVEGFSWTRTIETQDYKEYIEEDWTLPPDATLISSREEIRSYNNIPDGFETKTRQVQKQVGSEEYACGQRDLGNGYFETQYCERAIYETVTETYEEQKYRQEPVYDTKYKYSIWRWSRGSPLVASENDKSPAWPSTDVLSKDPHRRESGRKESYTVYLRDEKGKKRQEKLSLKRWNFLKKGKKYRATKNALGMYLGIIDEEFQES